MTQQTTAQSRVIDPILTTHAQGYVRPGNVGRFLFPIATVRSYGGQILTFGKEAFRRYNTKRAPGDATKRITFGYAGEKYAIASGGLEALVPDENQNDAKVVPGIDLASDSVDLVLDVLELEHEYECAEIALDATKYDADHKLALVGADRWTGTGDPTQDIKAGVEAIRKSVGVRPNTVLLSASAFAACCVNASIIERLKYTGRDSVTVEILARLWNVQTVVVGDAVGASNQDDELSDIWGDDVVIAYVAPPTGGNSRSNARPSYGYTYSITGMPLVRQPYYENNRRSWVYPVDADRTPVLTGMLAGYLLQDAGAAAA